MRKLYTNYTFTIKLPNMRFIKPFITTIILLTFCFSIYAQDPLGGRDLSTIKVDALSENQITAIQQKLKQSGMTIDQVESQAIAKGMSPVEFAKLKDRVNGVSGIVMAKSVKRGNINTQTATTNTSKDKDSSTVTINSNIKIFTQNFSKIINYYSRQLL